MEIEGQLNLEERRLLTQAILEGPETRNVLEVGTWLGGGSTIQILRALEQKKSGHLWGIEADQSVYTQMIANLRAIVPRALERFTPLFGRSQEVIPKWLTEKGDTFRIDLAFLDGGNNPSEQITEFKLIDPYIPVGGILMTHDAKLRKGRWLVPYISRLDNWKSELHDVSAEGLFSARKTAGHPSPASLRVAQSHLRRLRMAPAEIAAAILPARVRHAFFSVMPERITKRLAEGR